MWKTSDFLNSIAEGMTEMTTGPSKMKRKKGSGSSRDGKEPSWSKQDEFFVILSTINFEIFFKYQRNLNEK
jgi:hypothetical protein